MRLGAAERGASCFYSRSRFCLQSVSSTGTFRLHSGQHFLSQALNDEYIELEEIEDGLWNILFYETLLGRFNEHTHTITGAPL